MSHLLSVAVKTKTITFSLFGLLTAVLASVSIALYVIDWNKYRDTLAELASDRMGVRVELAGDLSLAFLPRPAVSAKLVRLTPGQSGFNDAIATADKIDMSLGLGALLGGSLELQSLAFDGLAANVIQTENGWTLEGWPQAEGEGDGDTSTFLSLDRFRINSGSISIRPLNGEAISLEGLDLTLAGALPSGPLEWSGSAIVTGGPVQVEGRMAPTRTVDATSLKTTIALEAGVAEFSGRIMANGALQGRFQASGNDLKAYAGSILSIAAQDSEASLPALPFGLDIQLERDSRGVSRMISRQATLGDTRGILDITVAESATGVHVAGTASFGVVPLDLWLETIAFESPEQTKSEAATTSVLSGGLDLNVETIEFRGSQIQQVGASIGFGAEGPALNQVTALLPGSSRFSYIAGVQDTGTFRFQSGGLQDVLSWAGINVSSAVPAGRLRTADIKGGISFVGNAWVVADVAGAVDTSNIAAEVSGTRQPFAVNAVSLTTDQLNLDAYWPDAKLPENNDEYAEAQDFQAIDFALDVKSLHWLNQSFTNVSIGGSVSPSQITTKTVSVSHMDGSAVGSLDVNFDNGEIADVATSIALTNWRFPIVTELVPDAGQYVNLFTNNTPSNGVIEMNGPVLGMQARVVLSSGVSLIDLAGTLAKADSMQGRLQGSVRHDDFGNLLSRARMWRDGNQYELPFASNVTFDGGEETFSFSATGEVGGSQFTVSNNYSEDTYSGEVSFSAAPGSLVAFDQIVAAAGYQLDASAPRRARFSYMIGPENWSFSGIDLRNGTASVLGDVSGSSQNVEGNLALSSIDLGRISSAQSAASESSSTTVDTNTVRLSLNVSDLNWMGQALEASAALLTGDGNQFQFTLGENASLNGAPISSTLSYEPKSGAFSGVLNARSFDMGTFASAVDAADGFSGTVSTELNVTGSLADSKNILSTLSGQGRFEGAAGSLYFMAVPELIRAMESENTATGFLQSIGQLLRSGTTDFANIRGSFQLDSGVALVDELFAAGEWGQLELDGQLNIPADYINMSGALSLSRPQDAPQIPVSYVGALSRPNVQWTSRAIEQFAIAGIERRLRTQLFGEFEAAQSGTPGGTAANPGSVVSDIAVGLLGRLRAQQEARRRAAEEAAASGDPVPPSEEQRP